MIKEEKKEKKKKKSIEKDMIEEGNILFSDADVIVQQCNCITKYPLGLSESIKKTLGVDPYGHRRLRKGKRNCAIREDQGKVGTCILYKRTKRPFYVACLFAQFLPGKPGKYYKEELKDRIDPISNHPMDDSAAQRLEWFAASLQDLNKQISHSGIFSEDEGSKRPIRIEIPYYIGCGLAGGCWEDYLRVIETWALSERDRFIVKIIRKDK